MKMMKIFKITYIFILYLTFAINVIANDEVGKLDLPTGANIVSGNVTIEKNTGKLIINQTSNQAIIEWQKFNVGANASVYFNHLNSPSVSSILNQIVAGGKSIINGNIYSNGKLFINNPNGITIGTNSNISAYSFIGSAMKIANQD